MRTDPIVDEIHRIRRAHAKRFNYDLGAIFADIRKRQAQRKKLVDLSRTEKAVCRVAESPAAYRTKRSKA
jgi:hypothetical protein